MNTQARIDELKVRLKAFHASTEDRDVFNNKPAIRMMLEIELLEHGCDVAQDQHGLLVNNRFIVAISSNQWCVKGKYVWYRYKDIPAFIAKTMPEGLRGAYGH